MQGLFKNYRDLKNLTQGSTSLNFFFMHIENPMFFIFPRTATTNKL